jgi:UPF0042 nucleotide-binding protein
LAANALEDLGYFCVDNLPIGLIAPFRELIGRSRDPAESSVLVIDAREGSFLQELPEVVTSLRLAKEPVELLFFDCSDDVLKRRFSESRRPHPIARDGATLDQTIEEEREALRPLREIADRIIDTSNFTAHQLRSFLKNSFDTDDRPAGLRINVVSFGFKYGVPSQVDLLFDVRFLPNPYFIDDLRPLTGRDPQIQKFLREQEATEEFFSRLRDFVDFLLPHYANEGKSYLTVAIGCTGGKHRSVALSEWLGKHLQSEDLPASISHRDLGRE